MYVIYFKKAQCAQIFFCQTFCNQYILMENMPFYNTNVILSKSQWKGLNTGT